eukprot:COSAG06_NODE_4316_length_4368_cov_30.639026_3_plen_221_part_00
MTRAPAAEAQQYTSQCISSQQLQPRGLSMQPGLDSIVAFCPARSEGQISQDLATSSSSFCSAPVGTCFGFVAAQFLFSTPPFRNAHQHPPRGAGQRPGIARMPGRLLVAGDGAHLRAPRAVLLLSVSALPPFIPTRRPLTGCCGARAAQIELLGYSGQFDYPEFLAEVRSRAPSALRARMGNLPPLTCRPFCRRPPAHSTLRTTCTPWTTSGAPSTCSRT